MAVTRIDIQTFLSSDFKYPVFDVRSEGEYEHAHIPGAVSIPLFNNEERKVIGTAYKKQSKQEAIKLGLGIFGKKMVEMVEEVRNYYQKHLTKMQPEPSLFIVGAAECEAVLLHGCLTFMVLKYTQLLAATKPSGNGA
jgi:tRNA 2-selenouridine synthase